jgi:hypothetical protein
MPSLLDMPNGGLNGRESPSQEYGALSLIWFSVNLVGFGDDMFKIKPHTNNINIISS